jgi:hypothetical protein
MVGWAIIERRFLDTPVAPLSAKSIGLLVASISIAMVFLTYVAILERNVLILDLATYGFSVALGQVASAALLSAISAIPLLRRAALLLLAAQLLAVSVLTCLPPHRELFRDPRDASYGIPISGRTWRLRTRFSALPAIRPREPVFPASFAMSRTWFRLMAFSMLPRRAAAA